MLRPALALACILLPRPAAGADGVPFVLPAPESPDDWRTALSMAGMTASTPPAAGPSVVVRVGAGEAWTLVVTDEQGRVREVPVDRPRSARDREGLALLAESLLHPIEVAAAPSDEAAETPVLARGARPPGPPPDARGRGALGRAATVGAGLEVGATTGLTVKAYLGGRGQALEAALGLASPAGFSAHAGWLLHPSVLYASADVAVPWHVGLGRYVRRPAEDLDPRDEGDDERDDDDDPPDVPAPSTAGLRVPVGVDLDVRSVPLQLFADVALLVAVVPAPRPGIEGAVGARYFFR